MGQPGPLGEQAEQRQVDGGARAHHGGRGHHSSPLSRKARIHAIIEAGNQCSRIYPGISEDYKHNSLGKTYNTSISSSVGHVI
jgi:hypothetical protein